MHFFLTCYLERYAAIRAEDIARVLHLMYDHPFMADALFLATRRREPRQVRKEAAAAVLLGAETPQCICHPMARALIMTTTHQHLALARKYRPKNFTEVVGQDPIVTALSNMFKLKRFHHAYCLIGTRGVGKTSLARILAKCFSCEQGESGTPCGTCSTCMEIDQGRYVDLIEVDAASRTKVDDTRALLDNVQYAPTRGRYKIYLIDEVHMLSTHSFNALLKTLEEPPDHVKFFLATTEAHKLPATILSRCLCFHLKAIPAPQIQAQLQALCQQEQIEADPTALHALSAAAHGSLRDALSILDQAIAYSGGALTQDAVQTLLGQIPQDEILKLLIATLAGDASGICSCLDQLLIQAADFNKVCEQLLDALHQRCLAAMVPDMNPLLFPEIQPLVEAIPDLNTTQALTLFQTLNRHSGQIDAAPSPRAGLEMLLLGAMGESSVEACIQEQNETRPPWTVTDRNKRTHAQNTTQLDQGTALNAPTQITDRPASSTQQHEDKAIRPSHTSHRDSKPNANKPLPSTLDTLRPEHWSDLVDALQLTGLARALASHSMLVNTDGTQINLALEPAQSPLMNPRIIQRIEQALFGHFKTAVKLNLTTSQTGNPLDTPAKQIAEKKQTRLNQAKTAMSDDPTSAELSEHFGATIRPETVVPID